MEKDWAVLEYISDPSDTLIQSALAQSGWAIRYIANPSEAVSYTHLSKTVRVKVLKTNILMVLSVN